MPISVGEPAPWFTAASTTNPKYHFQSLGGRYVFLSFIKSARDPAGRRVLEDLATYRDAFNDEFCCFFGVSIDPDDQQTSRLKEQIPGIRFFWDFDRNISQKFGVIEADRYRQCTYIIDERLRVFAVIPFGSQPENHLAILMAILSRLPEIPPPQPRAVSKSGEKE
jgi:peroxiredoxin